jgi:hypothetical protein
MREYNIILVSSLGSFRQTKESRERAAVGRGEGF